MDVDSQVSQAAALAVHIASHIASWLRDEEASVKIECQRSLDNVLATSWTT
jgi:hypothetical protein